MGFQYSDYGNHETWIDALQGGSFCRVNRLSRFFTGSDDVFACLGSEFFRVDSQVAINDSVVLGTMILTYSDVNEGVEKVSPVGIVEDEESEHGRYFLMKYVGDSEDVARPTTLVVYNSSYTAELDSVTIDDAWTPEFQLSFGTEQGMRVVNLGLVDGGDSTGRTYLYYLESTPSATTIYYVNLPDEGEAVSTAAPVKVADLDLITKNRFYVVHVEGDIVALYVGDTDKAQARRTDVLIHNPVTNTVNFGPKTIAVGSIPFPQSYAACKGIGDDLHIFLEPPSSWLAGWGTFLVDAPDTESELVPPRRKSSGNSWVLASMIQGGRILEEQLLFDGTDVQPWMGSTGADFMGDKFRASVIPWFICRQTNPPEKFSSSHGISVTGDISHSYIFFTAVGIRNRSPEELITFVERVDNIADLRPAFGNSRATSSIENTSPPTFNGGQVPSQRTLTNLLVPGTFLIEPLQMTFVGEFNALTTIGSHAQRLDNWRLIDDNAPYGDPNLAGSTIAPPAPVGAPGEHNACSDCAHGVKGDLFDGDLAVVVGWFVNGIGEPPP